MSFVRYVLFAVRPMSLSVSLLIILWVDRCLSVVYRSKGDKKNISAFVTGGHTKVYMICTCLLSVMSFVRYLSSVLFRLLLYAFLFVLSSHALSYPIFLPSSCVCLSPSHTTLFTGLAFILFLFVLSCVVLSCLVLPCLGWSSLVLRCVASRCLVLFNLVLCCRTDP
jgi:hypothetical protein